MLIVNIEYPGTWLELPDKDTSFSISNLISSMENTIQDLAITLTMFNESVLKNKQEYNSENIEEQWNIDNKLRSKIENEYISKLPKQNVFYENYEFHRQETDKLYREEKCKSGLIPNSYKHRVPYIHAHSFLSAADSFSKYLSVISNDTEIKFVADLLKEFNNALPTLRKIRNSAEHIEDRTRGYGKPADVRKKQKMELKPINNNLIKAENGGVLALSNLNGHKLGYTIDDGTYQELDINVDTLKFISDIFQRLINGFEWSGPKQLKPHI